MSSPCSYYYIYLDSSDSLGRNLGTRLIMSMTCSGVIVVEQNVLLICTLMSWTTEEVLMIELTPHVVPAKVIHLC